MQEFKLYDVVPRQEALEKGWRVLKFLGLTRRCSYVVKDFRALQPSLATRSLHSEQSANHESDCGCCGTESWMGSVGCGCDECVLS